MKRVLRNTKEIEGNIGNVVEKMERLMDEGKQEESFIAAIEHGSEQALLEIEPKFKRAVELLKEVNNTMSSGYILDRNCSLSEDIDGFLKGLE